MNEKSIHLSREKSAQLPDPPLGQQWQEQVKAAQAAATPTAIVVDSSVIEDLIALVKTKVAVTVANIRAKCVDHLVVMQVLGL